MGQWVKWNGRMYQIRDSDDNTVLNEVDHIIYFRRYKSDIERRWHERRRNYLDSKDGWEQHVNRKTIRRDDDR
jgi:hypothetical protein